MNQRSADPLVRLAWLTVWLLVPVALLNYLDRQMLAAMKSSMMDDIPDIATRANWGIVLGSFKWVYAILSPVGGYVADRVSRRRARRRATPTARRARPTRRPAPGRGRTAP